MSEAFECVVVAGTLDELPRLFGTTVTSDAIVVAIPDGFVAVSPPPPGGRRTPAGAEALAEAASLDGRAALHVVYDSGCGHRFSQLFRSGEACEAFGEETELWHELADDGQPITELVLRSEQLRRDEGREYQTAVDAITQGLRVLGVNSISGSDLVQLICYADEGS